MLQAIPRGALPGAPQVLFCPEFRTLPHGLVQAVWDAQEAWEDGTHLQCRRGYCFCIMSFWAFAFMHAWSRENGWVLRSHLSFAPNHVYVPLQNKAQDPLCTSGEWWERLQFIDGTKLIAWRGR